MRARGGPPIEWQAWNLTQTYACTPSVAWHELGQPPLTPRQRRRLVRAIYDLVGIERAFDSIKRKRGPKESPPTAEEILTAREAEVIFNEREQPVWDAIAAEIERETADTRAPGERVEPVRDVSLVDLWDAHGPDVIGGSLDDDEAVTLG
jgi:hypothetical protein